MRDVPEILKGFKSYKITIQNRSLKTVEEYLLDLDLFFRYIIASRHAMSLEGEEFDNINNLSNVFREDVVVESYPTEEILANANSKADDCFLVKKRSL